jgi:hypothetical protein
MRFRLILVSVLLPAVASDSYAQVSRNAPPDRPVNATAICQWNQLLKATAPLEAKARETFPGARQRFLQGLPSAHQFFATIRLTDSLSHHEQVFVAVDTIDGNRLSGRLASQIGVVQGYRRGQRLSFNDSSLVDWMIALPDGSEEGNIVGKFLDTYVPPKTCS